MVLRRGGEKVPRKPHINMDSIEQHTTDGLSGVGLAGGWKRQWWLLGHFEAISDTAKSLQVLGIARVDLDLFA